MEKFDKVLLFVIIYTFTCIIFFKTLNYTLPFVLALICALILKKPTEILAGSFKMKKSLSSLITTIIFFTIILSLLAWGVTQAAQEAVTFGKNLQNYININYQWLSHLFNNLQKYYNNLDPYIISTIENNFTSYLTKLSNLTVAISGVVLSEIVAFLASVPYIIMVIIFTMLATYFFTKDITLAESKLTNLIPDGKSEKVFSIIHESKKMLENYAASYMAIIGLTFIETLIVFIVFKVPYAILLSILCALFDFLPILGISAIYVPLSLIYILIFKNYIAGFGILISYIIVSIVRQLVEPKIVSSSLGIHPVAVLAAIFIGLKANGISGMFFCIFFVVFYNVLRRVDVL